MKAKNLDSREFTDSFSHVDIGQIIEDNNSQQNRYNDQDGHGLIGVNLRPSQRVEWLKHSGRR